MHLVFLCRGRVNGGGGGGAGGLSFAGCGNQYVYSYVVPGVYYDFWYKCTALESCRIFIFDGFFRLTSYLTPVATPPPRHHYPHVVQG